MRAVLLVALVWLTAPVSAGEPAPGEPLEAAGEAPGHEEGLAAYAARVRLHEAPVVDGDVIRLGEIAEIESGDPYLRERIAGVELGAAALPGFVREVSWGTLTLRLRQAGLSGVPILFEGFSDAISVKTRARRVEAHDVEALLREWYLERISLPEGAVLHLDVEAPAIEAAAQGARLVIASAGPRWGRSSIPVEVRVGDATVRRAWAWVTATLEQDVWVARRSLARGEVVGLGDVVLARLRLKGPVELFEPGEVRARRAIRAGEVLSSDLVEPLPLVARGERVQLVAATERVTVRVTGVARQDGWLGDEIEVENEASGAVVVGRVDGPGLVTVSVW